MATAATFSLKNRDTMESPYEFYEFLRQEAPVYRDPATGFFIVSRYGDVIDLLRDTVRFSSEIDRMAVHSTGADEEVIRIYSEKGWFPLSTLDADPPVHTKFRALLSAPFAPHAVKLMEPAMEELADRLVTAMLEESECDFIARFARPFPLTVMINLLGVPEEDREDFGRWTDAAIDVYGMMISREREIECAEEGVALQHYLAAKLKEREGAPRNDMLTHLNEARYDGERPLTIEEKLAIAGLLLVAGNHTTSNGLSNAMYILVSNFALMARLKESPEKIANFVEETLRLESPVQGEIRIVKEDTEFRGTFMPAGSVVNFRVAAANRDEQRFTQAERFDLDRSNASTHLAFGAGIHRCLGAQLARMEMNVAFRTLLKRLRNVSFVPGRNSFRHTPNAFLRGFEELHIHYEAENLS